MNTQEEILVWAHFTWSKYYITFYSYHTHNHNTPPQTITINHWLQRCIFYKSGCHSFSWIGIAVSGPQCVRSFGAADHGSLWVIYFCPSLQMLSTNVTVAFKSTDSHRMPIKLHKQFSSVKCDGLCLCSLHPLRCHLSHKTERKTWVDTGRQAFNYI